MPDDGRAVPVVARGEGRTLQTGFILRPSGATVKKVPMNGEMAAPAVGSALEGAAGERTAANRPVDRSVPVDLTGNMSAYVWGMTYTARRPCRSPWRKARRRARRCATPR